MRWDKTVSPNQIPYETTSLVQFDDAAEMISRHTGRIWPVNRTFVRLEHNDELFVCTFYGPTGRPYLPWKDRSISVDANALKLVITGIKILVPLEELPDADGDIDG